MMDKSCGYCGAELLISKKGNLYCSNICWKTDEYNESRLAGILQEIYHEDWGYRDD